LKLKAKFESGSPNLAKSSEIKHGQTGVNLHLPASTLRVQHLHRRCVQRAHSASANTHECNAYRHRPSSAPPAPQAPPDNTQEPMAPSDEMKSTAAARRRHAAPPPPGGARPARDPPRVPWLQSSPAASASAASPSAAFPVASLLLRLRHRLPRLRLHRPPAPVAAFVALPVFPAPVSARTPRLTLS